jgi:hypothetical protein
MRIWRNKSLSYLIKRWIIAGGGEGCARWPDQIASGHVTAPALDALCGPARNQGMVSSPAFVSIGSSFRISTKPSDISFSKCNGLIGDSFQRFALMSRRVQRRSIASRTSASWNGSFSLLISLTPQNEPPNKSRPDRQHNGIPVKLPSWPKC